MNSLDHRPSSCCPSSTPQSPRPISALKPPNPHNHSSVPSSTLTKGFSRPLTVQASQSRCLSLQKWDKSHTCGCHTSDRSDIFHSSNPSPFHLWCVGSRFLLITACRFTSLEHSTLTYDYYVCGFRPRRFVTMW